LRLPSVTKPLPVVDSFLGSVRHLAAAERTSMSRAIAPTVR